MSCSVACCCSGCRSAPFPPTRRCPAPGLQLCTGPGADVSSPGVSRASPCPIAQHPTPVPLFPHPLPPRLGALLPDQPALLGAASRRWHPKPCSCTESRRGAALCTSPGSHPAPAEPQQVQPGEAQSPGPGEVTTNRALDPKKMLSALKVRV